LLLFAAASMAALPACALFPHRKPNPLLGSWTNRTGAIWTVNRDGTIEVDVQRDGKRDSWGTYTIDVDTLTIRSVGGLMPNGCGGDGIYRFKREGAEVTFTLVSDSCKLRRTTILLGWHRVR
jgi:hypothetical protein